MQRFLAFAFAFADVLIEVDDRGRILLAMGACRALLGIEDAKLVGTRFLDLFDAHDRGTIEAATRGLWPGARRGPIPASTARAGEGGAARRIVLHACRLPGQKSAFACTLSLAGVATTARARDLRVDPKSGLLEEASFIDAAGETIRAARAAGEEVDMSLIDIPDLQTLALSDPTAGERLIARVGDVLRATAIDGVSAGRLSPSRFGVVTRARDEELARRVESVRAEGRDAGVEMGVAVTCLRLASETLSDEDTIKAVRFAVNRFAALPKGETMGAGTLDGVFEKLMETTRERMSSFVQIIRTNEFVLAYQPIVEIATGRLHHFEALSRFDDGDSPFETIKFAEEIDLIARFDLAVLTRAIEVLGQPWEDQPALAINLSGRSIADPAFTRVLLDLAAKHAALAGRLAFEITESSELRDLSQAGAFVRDLRGNGYQVWLDDFGAGAAGFRYLQSLDVDGVKIDGEYVARAAKSPRDHTILAGMVGLARAVGLETVAERIENRETAQRAHALGVRYGQGWYYGKPLLEPVWFPGPGHPLVRERLSP